MLLCSVVRVLKPHFFFLQSFRKAENVNSKSGVVIAFQGYVFAKGGEVRWDVCGTSIPHSSATAARQSTVRPHGCLLAVTWGPGRLLGTGFWGHFYIHKFLYLPLAVLTESSRGWHQAVKGSPPRQTQQVKSQGP